MAFINDLSNWLGSVFDRMNLKDSVRWQSKRNLFGKPLVHIAWGADKSNNEKFGHAKGIIAIGQMATGFVAIGIVSYGIISIGLVSLGIICFSWLVGLGAIVFSGLAFGIVAFGGVAIGIIAIGGMAIGYVAIGGFSIGIYAVGGFAIGKFIASPVHTDPEIIEFYSKYLPILSKSLGFSR